MIIEVKIPSPGESITEVELGRWLVEDGAIVKEGQEIAEIESDKATLTISASASGKITFRTVEGQRLAVGSTACTINTDVEPKVAPIDKIESTGNSQEVKKESPSAQTIEDITPTISKVPEEHVSEEPQAKSEKVKVTKVAQEMMDDYDLSVDEVIAGLRRISKKDIQAVIEINNQPDTQAADTSISRKENRQPVSTLRKKLSERLVAAKNLTAMLTTFNEVDMSQVISIREKYQQQFTDKYGLKLGYISFFAKAVTIAIKEFPSINSQMEAEEIIFPEYVDLGIAVQTQKGLMVPVLRNAQSKTIAEIERQIKELAERARTKKITVEELAGGTFTITNGGVFGSLFSTPILNPPQSAILGMHKIMERPIAYNGQVVIRPMMYVALSYDHRLIDGRDSVGFLLKIKELIENPVYLFSEGKNPEEMLLGL